MVLVALDGLVLTTTLTGMGPMVQVEISMESTVAIEMERNLLRRAAVRNHLVLVRSPAPPKKTDRVGQAACVGQLRNG